MCIELSLSKVIIYYNLTQPTVVIEQIIMLKPGVPLRVLVTGATGYIASHLIRKLRALGKYKVRGTVRSLSDSENDTKRLCQIESDNNYPLELVEADLNEEKGWTEAVHNCTFVYHVASPAPIHTPKDENDVLSPAINGTVNVLKACAVAGTVKRVVLTSSVAAVTLTDDSHCCTEQDWTSIEPASTPAYVKSKVLAEKAAWNFIASLEENKRFELAVINPGLVVGPSLLKKFNGSLNLIKSILNNEMTLLPDLTFSAIHVQDAVSAHIAAMEIPEAANHRHIVTGGDTLSLTEIADIIRNEFAPRGYRIPSKTLPKFLLWPFKFINQDVRTMYPILGKRIVFDNQRMRNVLHIQPNKDMTRDGILESCYSMIEMGFVPKTQSRS